MASQRATEVIGVQQEGEGRVNARLRLACGCVVQRSIAADRILQVDAGPIAVGKYSCPEGHALSKT